MILDALSPARAHCVVRLPAPCAAAVVALHPGRGGVWEGGAGLDEGGSDGDDGSAPSPSSPCAPPASGPPALTLCVATAEGVLYEYGVELPACGGGRGGGHGGGRTARAGGGRAWLERELFLGRTPGGAD